MDDRPNRSEEARVLYEEFKAQVPSHKYMLAPQFWNSYTIWLENELLKCRTNPPPGLMGSKHYCKTCDLYFHPMGIARHRAMHRDRKEDCTIETPSGLVVSYNFSKTPKL
jgi:hypothetical protein